MGTNLECYWKALEVDEATVARVPQVSGVLKAVGGKAKILGYLRSSLDPDARKILDLVDGANQGPRLKAAWTKLPMEAFCVAAGLSTQRLVEIVAGEVFRTSGQVSGLLAAASHPKIVEKSIEEALGANGLADRRMLHQHAQFLPMAKTQFVNLHGGLTIDQRSQSVNLAVAPPVEETVKKLSDRFNSRPAPELLVAAEPEDDEEDEEDDSE